MSFPITSAFDALPVVSKFSGGPKILLTWCCCRKIFKDHFVTACVDFGVALSNNFLSSLAFLGFYKALEEDAMSSSFSSKHMCILVFDVIFFSYANFQRPQKHRCYELYWDTLI